MGWEVEEMIVIAHHHFGSESPPLLDHLTLNRTSAVSYLSEVDERELWGQQAVQ